MNLYVLCIDPERGKYLAFSADDPNLRAESYTSVEEAVGLWIIKNPGTTVDRVIGVET